MTEFDPTLYGMAAEYDEQGNYKYPEGFDPETNEWLDGLRDAAGGLGEAVRRGPRPLGGAPRPRSRRPPRPTRRPPSAAGTATSYSSDSSRRHRLGSAERPGRRGHPRVRRGPRRTAREAHRQLTRSRPAAYPGSSHGPVLARSAQHPDRPGPHPSRAGRAGRPPLRPALGPSHRRVATNRRSTSGQTAIPWPLDGDPRPTGDRRGSTGVMAGRRVRPQGSGGRAGGPAGTGPAGRAEDVALPGRRSGGAVPSVQPHPGVEDRVEEVDDDVRDDDGGRGEQDDPDDDRKVLLVDRVDGGLAEPGRLKTCSVTTAPPSRVADVDAELGDHRGQRAAQGVPEDDPPLAGCPWSGRCGRSPHRGRRASSPGSAACTSRPTPGQG